MKRAWRRRNYFIKKDLQGKYIFSFFIFVVAGSFLFTGILGFLSSDSLTIVYKDYNLQLGKTPLVLIREILRAHWIFIATGGIVVILASMFLTHRFAGPLYRLERSVEEMKKGNFDFEIRLRSKDEAKELARMLNEFNTELSLRLRESKQLCDAIDRHLTDARNSSAGGDEAQAIDRAISHSARLREVLDSFILKNAG